MKEILHVQKVSGISGSEAHLLSVLPQLRERGWDVRMIVLHEGEEGAREFVRRLHVPCEEVRLRADVDPLASAQLARRFTGAGAVHAHLAHAHLLALPAALVARVPVRIAHYHGFTWYPERRRFLLVERYATRAANVHVSLSEGHARELAAHGVRRRFEIAIYGIAPGPAPPPPPPEPRLLAIGRLTAFKGFDVLLRAFARARREVPELTLELAGSGSLEADLRALAVDGVRFLGHVAPIAPVLERNAILVAPSLAEGLGLVALEAMERGRAVLASASGGLPELVVDGETGLVVPVGDEGALARAMVELARDPERVRTMGAAGRARVIEAFPEERPADVLDALYTRLLGGR